MKFRGGYCLKRYKDITKPWTGNPPFIIVFNMKIFEQIQVCMNLYYSCKKFNVTKSIYQSEQVTYRPEKGIEKRTNFTDTLDKSFPFGICDFIV